MRLRTRGLGYISAQAKVAELHVAVAVEKQVAWFDIPVEKVRRMHEFESFHQLVNNVLLVNLLQNIRANDGVKVSLCRGRTTPGGVRIYSEKVH